MRFIRFLIQSDMVHCGPVR